MYCHCPATAPTSIPWTDKTSRSFIWYPLPPPKCLHALYRTPTDNTASDKISTPLPSFYICMLTVVSNLGGSEGSGMWLGLKVVGKVLFSGDESHVSLYFWMWIVWYVSAVFPPACTQRSLVCMHWRIPRGDVHCTTYPHCLPWQDHSSPLHHVHHPGRPQSSLVTLPLW